MTRAAGVFLALLSISLPTLAPQNSQIISVDQEPHHHLVLQNVVVKVFEVDLEPRDSLPMHRHDSDAISIPLGGATTVSTAPGQADVLMISKPGDVIFTPSGWVHSVRNIGQTAYRMVSIQFLQPQTSSNTICGTQLSKLKGECLPIRSRDWDSSALGLPQFATDQILLTLTRIGPHQRASFGEADRDNLIVAIDDAAILAAPSGNGLDQILAAGSPLWIPRGGPKQDLKNTTDQVLRVVTVAFKSEKRP